MMIPPGQERLPRRRAQRGRVETEVFQAVRGDAFRVGRPAGAAERARRAEARIVDEHDEDIGCAGWRQQLPDGWVLRLGIFRVVGDRSRAPGVRNREDGSVELRWEEHKYELQSLMQLVCW